ncbi:hypothetical protein [Streptomyces sp. NPDC051567]|uniref:hypothetical protein n=1 Tax=Streptomyces sp. NPDC051567 TaxID=3365660 RepID=UPI00379F4D96
MRSWHFFMHPQEPLTPEQSDTMDHLDCFADACVGLDEGPNYSRFSCYVHADTLLDAMNEALARVEEIPGVQIRSIELTPYSFDHNGMATAATAPDPFADPV